MPNKNIIKRKKQPGKHSCPSTSGKQNLTKYHIENYKGKGGGKMMSLYNTVKHGSDLRQEYKGKWTEELLEAEIMDYIKFCAEEDVKPAKVGLRLWLGVSESTYWEWEQGNSKHSDKSKLIGMANDFMEYQYVNSIESFPTGNIFLLKSSHGHSDKQQVEISGKEVNSDTISETINKLGLDE